MPSSTLTSLAMLKVHLDQGRDYLDYLRPFVLQVLVDHKPEPVTDAVVCDYIRSDFGLEIPERAIQIVLKRLARKQPLKREQGVYQITGQLDDPRIGSEKASAERHIKAVVANLMEFSRTTTRPISTDEEAVTAICAFLAQFDIPCLRSYLRGTAIPSSHDHHDSLIVLVSKYVTAIQKADPERFESFLVLVKGHMLANSLLCPDLQDAPKSYSGVTFFLDTPLLVRLLGLEGIPKQDAIRGLIELLRNLGAVVAVFTHSREELDSVIKGAADHINVPCGRGAIVEEARKRGTTKSDLLLLAGKIDGELELLGVKVLPTPSYIADFQIDETSFEKVLDDEVSYFNPHAKRYDINSVRSIYVLRAGSMPCYIEKAKAVLVTNNGGFSRAAFQYGQRHEESQEISPVITDFSLANMAWLKAPLGAPSLPMTEVLAFSYAALQPSKEILDKYLCEIDKLEKQGKITPRDHQLLRSSQLAKDELMDLTLGEEEALTEQTITETLARVTGEIKAEESAKFSAERDAHKKTQAVLAAERESKRRIQEGLYWQCMQKARRYAWAASSGVAILLLFGLVKGIGFRSSNAVMGWLLIIGSGVLLFVSLYNLILGTTVRQLHGRFQDRCLTWLLKRESAATGLDLRSPL